jgi:hypothetical protein
MTAKMLGDLAYVGTALALMTLSGGFLLLTRWWQTGVGRSLAAFLFVVFAIMLWTFLLLTGIVDRNAAWLNDLRALLFGGLCLASWSLLIGFVKIQFFPHGLRSWSSTSRKSRDKVP